jgi:diguanylate cyclase (GGDEF)-like protein
VIQSDQSLDDIPYVEMVRSLFFGTFLPACLMSAAFAGTGLLIDSQTSDPVLRWLTLIGILASILRLALHLHCRRRARLEALTVARARVLEYRFAAGYLLFALVLGAFGARAFHQSAPDARILITVLLLGYVAGVAAGLAMRLWISVSSMLIALAPTVAVAAMNGNLNYRAFVLIVTALLIGGIHSTISRFRSERTKIAMRLKFASLARHDSLTGLYNRLALFERFDEFVARTPQSDIAIHCLDLDRFKPVNDHYGHPIGDALLQAVAKRLSKGLRDGDFAARMGGDEFVIVQFGVSHAKEAELLAERISNLVSGSYVLLGKRFTVGVSIGFALTSRFGVKLDRLLKAADEALYTAKRQGGGRIVEAGKPNLDALSMIA